MPIAFPPPNCENQVSVQTLSPGGQDHPQLKPLGLGKSGRRDTHNQGEDKAGQDRALRRKVERVKMGNVSVGWVTTMGGVPTTPQRWYFDKAGRLTTAPSGKTRASPRALADFSPQHQRDHCPLG